MNPVQSRQEVPKRRSTFASLFPVAMAAGLVGAGIMIGRISKKKHVSKVQCYTSQGPSCCLIINNIFNAEGRDSRYQEHYHEGMEAYTEKLGKLFSERFKSRVWTIENVSSVHLNTALQDFQNKAEKRNYGGIFVVIMSHGRYPSHILMDDLKEVDLYKDIVYKFKDVLKGRPKVFFNGACRSVSEAILIPEDTSSQYPPDENIRDVLVAHAAIPHCSAYGNSAVADFFFHTLDEVCRKNAKPVLLRHILLEVNKEVRDRFGQSTAEDTFGFLDYRV